MTGRLAGKIAIVIGAGGGLGQAVALLFAREGAKLMVTEADAPAAKAVARQITEAGGSALAMQVDVTKAEDLIALAVRTAAELGLPSVLFNNVAADLESAASLAELSETAFDRMIEANYKGAWLAMKYVAPGMKRAGGGSIINVASLSALRANRRAGYAASQGAVAGLSRVAAAELGPYQIRVNAICPGATDGPLGLHVGAEQDDGGETAPARLSFLGRAATAAEIAKFALYLASDDASFVTGGTHVIDGGWSLMSGIEKHFS